ncbi:hypothetical protein Tco_0670228 [Tanacetum coccineum]
MYMAKIQEVLTTELGPSFDVEPLEKVDNNAILDSLDMCDNEGKDDQNDEVYDDEHVVLANLIANLKLDTDENKKIQKQLKKANASLTHELNECKSTLEESNGIRDRCRSALHLQEIKLEKYKSYQDCTIKKEEVERKLKESLGLLAQQKIDSKEVLKTQGYEIVLFKEKNTELVQQSSLEHIKYDRLQKEKEKLQKDFKFREEKDIDNLIALENQEYLDQLYYADEAQKKMWRTSFVKYKPNIAKNIGFLPTQSSLSKSRHAFNTVQHNINHFKTIVELAWEKRMDNQWQQPTTQEITVLVKNLLIPLAIKSRENAYEFENAFKQEIFEDLEYVQSLEKEVDKLKSEKAEFSNEYDLLLQEFVSKDIVCSILRSFESLDEKSELQCLYLEKIAECECLAIEISKRT